MRASAMEPDVTSAIHRFGQPQQEPLTKALVELANKDPEVVAGLRRRPAINAVQALEAGSPYFKSVGGYVPRVNTSAAMLRADPLFGILGNVLPPAGVAARSEHGNRTATAAKQKAGNIAHSLAQDILTLFR